MATKILAALEVETERLEGAEQTEVGPRDIVAHRPAGTGIKNDVFRAYWMQSGLTYRITYDGTGIRVTGDNLPSDHTFYLVDAQDARQFVWVLPTGDGVIELRDVAYELAEVDGAWTIRTM